MQVGGNARRYTLTLALMAISAIWFALGSVFPRDDQFTVLRVASQMSAGHGSTFGTLDPDTSALPLASIPFVVLPLPREPALVSAIGLLAGMVGAWLLSRFSDTPWSALAFLLFFAVHQSLPVLLMIALALTGAELALRRDRWWAAGLCVGLALLSDPAAGWLAVLLALIAIQRGDRRMRGFFAATILGGGWLLIAGVMRGAPPVALEPAAPMVALVGLAGVAVFRLYPRRGSRVDPQLPSVVSGFDPGPARSGIPLAVWSAGLLISPTMPHPAVAVGLIALAGQLRPRVLVIIAALADVLLALVFGLPLASGDARVVGQWIAENTGPDTLIATDQGSPLVFYAQRRLIDLSGRWQLTEGRTLSEPSFFVRYAPDAVVIREGSAVAWDGFPTTYAATFRHNDLVVYQRVVNFTPLFSRPADVAFLFIGRDDIRLVGLAVAEQASPGDMLRVRLDWLLSYASRDLPLEIRVGLVSTDGIMQAETRQTFPAAYWTAGHNDTTHLIALRSDLPAGELRLAVGIGARGAVFAPQSVASVLIR